MKWVQRLIIAETELLWRLRIVVSSAENRLLSPYLMYLIRILVRQ